MDLFPGKMDVAANDFYKLHLMGVHSFMRVHRITPKLEMAPLNPDWLKTYLKEHPGAIRHEKVEDEIVLSAQPRELQAFLTQHDNDEDVWGKFTKMERRKGE